MAGPFAAFGFVNLCLAFTALELSTFLNSQCGAGTTTCGEAPLHSAAVLAPLAALGVLVVAVARTYYHLSRRHAAAVPVAGPGNGRRSHMFLLCSPLAATFFLGMMLIIITHVRAGGEGGGGAGAGAGDGPIQGILRVLTKVAAGMAAALVGLMAMAVTLHGAKF